MNSVRSSIYPDSTLRPGESQKRARELFRSGVEGTALNWWAPGEPLPSEESFVLVGVVVWSGYDMNLLDLLNDAVVSTPDRELTAYVFDADLIRSEAEFEAIFPGLGLAHHTPMVGYWKGGALLETGCGYLGRQIVARLFGIDDSLVLKRVSFVPIAR